MKKEFDITQLETLFPQNGDFDFKHASEKEKSDYKEMYLLYRHLFMQFLQKKLCLKDYDNKIAQSGLDFTPCDEESEDVYQYMSQDYLKYFYLRNNTYVEKLSDEQKAFLKQRIKAGDYEYDESCEKFIEETYKNVITEDELKDGKTRMAFYGPNSSNFMAPNNSVVIGFNYNEFNTHGLDDKKWGELHDKQIRFLIDLLYDMAEDVENKLDVPTIIKRYSGFSIIRLKKKEINLESPEEPDL